MDPFPKANLEMDFALSLALMLAVIFDKFKVFRLFRPPVLLELIDREVGYWSTEDYCYGELLLARLSIVRTASSIVF